MKTGIVAALLLLGLLAPMTAAIAGPADAVVACAVSIASPDGQYEHVNRLTVYVDVIDQDPACLD